MADTRTTHAVRIKDKDTGQWVDVRVVDAIALTTKNGDEFLIDTSASRANPQIVDKTGDGNGKNAKSPSRKSHMVRVTNPKDKHSFMDIEVLDSIAFKGPNGQEWTLDMTSKRAVCSIHDDTDLGVGVDKGAKASRHAHMKKITVSSGDSAHGVSDPAGPGPFLAVQILDGVAYQGVNGNEFALTRLKSHDPNDQAAWNDKTRYTSSDDDSKEPPLIETTRDKNVYVKFVKDPDTGHLGSPWVGKNPTYGDGTTHAGTDQGLLWWIEDAGQPGPWYYWPPLQQPFDISGLGGPCFQRTTTVSFIHILYIAPWVLIPIDAVIGGLCGYKSLEHATAFGLGATTGWFGTAANNILALNFLQPPGNDLSNEGNILDSSQTRLNMYQIMGAEQPFDVHNNPVLPSEKKQKKLARQWRDMWNATSLAWDANVESGLCSGSNPASRVFWPYPIPIGHVNFLDGLFSFIAGLPVQWPHAGGPVFSGAWAMKIEVGQLDPNKWDTSGIFPQPWPWYADTVAGFDLGGEGG